MPAAALVSIFSLSPIVRATFLLSAACSKILRSGAIDGGLFRAPCGLPLCPGLNWCSRGGHPGPTRYSAFGERGLIVVRDVMRFRCEGSEVVAVIASSEFAVTGVPTSRRSARCDWRARSCQPEAAARARDSGAGRGGWLA